MLSLIFQPVQAQRTAAPAAPGACQRDGSRAARSSRLSQAEYLRCRVRYFTDGVVLGGKEFVESIFQGARERFAPGRKDGARPLRGLELAKKRNRLYMNGVSPR